MSASAVLGYPSGRNAATTTTTYNYSSPMDDPLSFLSRDVHVHNHHAAYVASAAPASASAPSSEANALSPLHVYRMQIDGAAAAAAPAPTSSSSRPSRSQQQQQQQHNLSVSSPSPTPTPSSPSAIVSATVLPSPEELPIDEPMGAAHAFFSRSEVPPILSRLIAPILYCACVVLFVVIVVRESECGMTGEPFAPARPETGITGWCCLSGFSRYVTLFSYGAHVVVLGCFLYFYNTVLLRFLPRRRACVDVSFMMRAMLIVITWMAYALIISLAFINTLPEQIECAASAGDRALFYPPDVVNWLTAALVEFTVALLARKLWKYWHLRHLTPEEIIQYEDSLLQNQARGLTPEQLAVLLQVTLTCTHGTSTTVDCAACGHREYQAPTMGGGGGVSGGVASVSRAVVSTVVTPLRNKVGGLAAAVSASSSVSASASSSVSSPRQSLLPATPSSSPSSSSSSSQLRRAGISYDEVFGGGRSGSSGSSDDDRGSDELEPLSRASLVALGGFPTMQCGICLEDYRVHARVFILPCHHHGHVQCLKPWFRGHSTCPTCRSKVVRSTKAGSGGGANGHANGANGAMAAATAAAAAAAAAMRGGGDVSRV